MWTTADTSSGFSRIVDNNNNRLLLSQTCYLLPQPVVSFEPVAVAQHDPFVTNASGAFFRKDTVSPPCRRLCLVSSCSHHVLHLFGYLFTGGNNVIHLPSPHPLASSPPHPPTPRLPLLHHPSRPPLRFPPPKTFSSSCKFPRPGLQLLRAPLVASDDDDELWRGSWGRTGEHLPGRLTLSARADPIVREKVMNRVLLVSWSVCLNSTAGVNMPRTGPYGLLRREILSSFFFVTFPIPPPVPLLLMVLHLTPLPDRSQFSNVMPLLYVLLSCTIHDH